MSLSLFEALKSYIGFTSEDTTVLRELYPHVRGYFPAIVDDFYLQISLHDATRRILEGPEQIERLKVTLAHWLAELFLGPHDATYHEKRTRIGLTHVRIGLPQAYVFGAMTHIRRHVEEAILEEMKARPGLLRQGLVALAKVLALDVALITGSYHEAEKYRDLVESAPDMIHQIDRQGRIVSVNRTEQVRLGYSLEELLGKPLVDLVPEEDQALVEQHLDRVFQTGAGRCEVRLLTSRGEPIEVEILATGVSDPVTGEIVRTRAYVRDIGERKRAEDALRREKETAQKYLDVAGAVICVIGADGKFLLMNKKGCEVLGRSEEEIVGKDFSHFIPEKHRDDVRHVFGRLMGGDIETVEWHENPVLTRSGEERLIQWRNTVIRDGEGKITGTLSSGIDVTERKRMEKLLLEQTSLARLGEMAAIVAHEVKNPLAGISGALQVISTQLPPESSGRTIVHDILERLDALNNVVNDLLLFSRPRLPRFAPVPLLSLFQNTVSLLMQDPTLGKVEVETRGEDVVVPGDAELLKPVFVNLLLNAAQAMNGSGKISVAVEAVNGSCRIAVTDSGPGIPAHLREKIFEPFFSTKHRGTGLGLPISKRIVEAHGGDISVSCAEGGGTTVLVELPLQRRS